MRPVRPRLALATAVTALAALLAAPAEATEGAAPPSRTAVEAGSTVAEVPRLQRRGRWLVDRQGRVVLVHGVNLVWKHAPYAPPATAEGFTARDARWLRRHGFNGARLGTLWAGLTPDRPGVVDPAYARRWQRVMDLLADRRIWMQLDFHQDMWHETYGGEGVPDWAAARPLPFALIPPVNAPFPMGYWTPEVSSVFDDFWAGRRGLLEGWVAAWRVAARQWRNQPYSMGYDLLNEPWVGTEGLTCLVDGCRASYAAELQPAFEKALAAIREADPHSLVWFEPQQFAGGQPLDTYFEAVEGERNLGFSWHSYCPQVFFESQGLPGADTSQCRDFAAGRNAHALDQGRRMRAATLMTEFGATDNVDAVRIDADAADDHLMGWTYWAYKWWRDPTTADGDQGLFRDDTDLASAKQEKLRALVRTYPQATAGTPLTLSFDSRTGLFRYTYRPRALRAPTVIFVSPLHYPGTPRVQVQGGRLLTRPDARRLKIRAAGTGPVTVVVSRQ